MSHRPVNVSGNPWMRMRSAFHASEFFFSVRRGQRWPSSCFHEVDHVCCLRLNMCVVSTAVYSLGWLVFCLLVVATQMLHCEWCIVTFRNVVCICHSAALFFFNSSLRVFLLERGGRRAVSLRDSSFPHGNRGPSGLALSGASGGLRGSFHCLCQAFWPRAA